MKVRNQQGQSTIEFIFTFAFGVSIIFVMFNSALNYATGYLVHYATFMASRSYLTQETYLGSSADTQSSMSNTAALGTQSYNKYMLQIFSVPSDAFRVNPPGLTPSEYLTTGATTIFDLKIDAIGRITGQTTLELASESYLGKEPTRAQCANRTCFAITGNTTCNNTMDITLYDDGC
jgi:hypothetical protein